MKIIAFNSTKCRHCYKCIRHCEIKAISVSSGRAEIIEDHCILCGHCMAICPQEAKTMTSELGQVKAMIRRGEKVAAQLAPSYLGLLPFDTPGQVHSALKKLGFVDAFETAEGAAAVTDAYIDLIRDGTMDNIITTCCPAVNDLIEMYHPSLVPSLAPVVSPMIASGRMIKKKLGADTRVVFIGPCIAKRKEARDARHADAVDAVINFHELSLWLQEADIRLENCEDEPFAFDSAVNRLYPVTGGVLTSVQATLNGTEPQRYRQLYVHGVRGCIELCKDLEAGSLHNCVIEMNICDNGCIKGSAVMEKDVYPFKTRLDMEQRIQPDAAPQEELHRSLEGVSLEKTFMDRSPKELTPSEEEIRAILAKTGKKTPEDELNCGACGYSSCRDKAIAVYQGKAELEMCIPYLTSQAESMANLILKESPNAFIITDSMQRILEYSAAGKHYFGLTREEALGRFLIELIDPTDCETVYRTHQNIYGKKVYYEQYQLWTLQNIVYIPKQDSTLMTFIDITVQEKRAQREQERRLSTIQMAQKVIRNQMFTAQKIAGLLGATTAETKMTLTNMMQAMQDMASEENEEEETYTVVSRSDRAEAFAPGFTDELNALGAPDVLPMVAPAVKPKLHINTQYAKPKRPPSLDALDDLESMNDL